VALIEYLTPFKRTRRGVCSEFLSTLIPAPNPHSHSHSSSSSSAAAAVGTHPTHSSSSHSLHHTHSSHSLQHNAQPPAASASASAAPHSHPHMQRLTHYVPVYVKRGSVALPAQPSVPLLMIGPGTGIAPFRAMIWHRHALMLAAAASTSVSASAAPTSAPSAPTASASGASDAKSGSAAPHFGPIHLFFGNRYSNRDFLYGAEFVALATGSATGHSGGAGVRALTSLHTAFSRDQPDKVYVQHSLLKEANLVWSVLHHSNGVLLLAGYGVPPLS
jgi:sulfite reductase alpha subunit-like flavoprotein